MDLKNIDKIIKKFYEGKTNLEEEKILKSFLLQNNNLPDYYNTLKTFFRFTELESNIKSPGSKAIVPKKQFKKQAIAKIYGSIAVAVTIALLVTTFNNYSKPLAIDEINTITYNQRKQVYNQTKEALLLISENLNKGKNEIKRLAIIDEVSKHIIKN